QVQANKRGKAQTDTDAHGIDRYATSHFGRTELAGGGAHDLDVEKRAGGKIQITGAQNTGSCARCTGGETGAAGEVYGSVDCSVSAQRGIGAYGHGRCG